MTVALTVGSAGHRWAAVGLIVAGMILTATAAAAETRFALIVGHNVGQSHETPLRWAEEDARRMKRVLSQVGEVRPERSMLLLSPTVEAFEAAHERMKGRIAEARDRADRPMLFFYFSGHADNEALHFGREAVPIESLLRSLRTGPTTTVAVIDACRNDRAPRSRAKGGARAPGFVWPRPLPAGPTGFVLLTSAAAGEVAQESDDLQGSLFTHHLLSGMRGSADVDHDGAVTLSELYRFGYRQTLTESHRRAGAIQHGEASIDLKGSGALIITYPKRAHAWLEFGPQVRGHVLIVDDRSKRIVAEVLTHDRQKVAMAPGRYRIQLREQERFRSGLVDVVEGGTIVKRSALDVQSTLAVVEKGATFDPLPWRLRTGATLRSSFVQGFTGAVGIDAEVARQWTDRWRVALEAKAGYARAERDVVRQQLETTFAVGTDFVGSVLSEVDLLAGVRLGVVWVAQRVERADDRIESLELTAVDEGRSAVGPMASAVLAVEYFPWTQLGVRTAAHAAIAWLSVDGGINARPVVGFDLSMVVRL